MCSVFVLCISMRIIRYNKAHSACKAMCRVGDHFRLEVYNPPQSPARPMEWDIGRPSLRSGLGWVVWLITSAAISSTLMEAVEGRLHNIVVESIINYCVRDGGRCDQPHKPPQPQATAGCPNIRAQGSNLELWRHSDTKWKINRKWERIQKLPLQCETDLLKRVAN